MSLNGWIKILNLARGFCIGTIVLTILSLWILGFSWWLVICLAMTVLSLVLNTIVIQDYKRKASSQVTRYLSTGQRVVAAAIRYGDIIFVGARHFDATMVKHIRFAKIQYDVDSNRWSGVEEGFIDNYGQFLNRKEALDVATAAGQINTVRPKTWPEDELCSEDIY